MCKFSSLPQYWQTPPSLKMTRSLSRRQPFDEPLAQDLLISDTRWIGRTTKPYTLIRNDV